jgi:iron complex outermembrane receptor protein
MHTFLAGLKWEKQFKRLFVEISANKRRNYDRYELIRDSSYGRNLHRTDVEDVQIRANYLSFIGKTIAGIHYRNEQILSTNLGKALSDSINADFYNGISPRPQYAKGAKRNIIDYYIDHSLNIRNFSVSAGILASCPSDFANNINAGADFAYQLPYNAKIYASINSSLRHPTYTDLYYKGPGYAGNSSLAPEKALTYETGIKYAYNRFYAGLSIYRRLGKDIIDWLKTSEADNWQSHNITKVNVTGLELSGAYIFKNTWIKKIQISGAWQNLTKDAQNYISKYVLDYLKYKANACIDHKLFINELTTSWRFTYQDRAGDYIDFKTNKRSNYKAFALVDLKINYAIPYYNVYIEASNIFNTKYVDIANIEQAGTWIKIGMQINIF